jgi:glycogen synthase
MKRVLMTGDTVGGVWTYCIELCRALADHDVEIALCTMGREPSSAQLKEVKALDNVEYHPSEFRLEWMADPWEDVEFAGSWLLNIAEEFQPDLIHLNTFAHGDLQWGAPTLMVGHSCVFSWWQAVHGTRPPRGWDTYRRYVSAGVQAVDQVIAPSKAMLAELQRIYGRRENCSIIPNALPRAPKVEAAKKPFILCAGRLWDEAKNVSLLAQISVDLLWPVYVAGQCDKPDGSRAMVGSLKCLGELSRDDVAVWQQTASIYAAPAKYEPFGLAILEAAAAGCALVLSDIPSLRENWQGAAEFVDPRNPRAWIETLNRLTANSAQREQLAARARERATQFTIDRMANSYMQTYSQLIAQTAEVVA